KSSRAAYRTLTNIGDTRLVQQGCRHGQGRNRIADDRRAARVRQLYRDRTAVHRARSRYRARPRGRLQVVVARPRRQGGDPPAVPGLSRTARLARLVAGRDLARRPSGFHGPAAADHRAGPGPGAARQLFRLSLPVRAVAGCESPAMAAARFLRGGGTAANPPGTAQDAAPVAQRSRRDRARLVRTRTVLLSRESRSRGGLSWLIRVEAAEDQ